MISFRTVRTPLVLALLALTALVAGCGATDAVDKQEYIKENNKIQTDAASALSGLNSSDAKSIDAAVKQIDAATAKLEDLEVPADYKDEHASMIDALEDLSKTMSEIKVAVKNKNVAKANELVKEMQAEQTQFNKAIDGMNADLA